MKARKIVESGSFGPEALKVAYGAFDAAWETIAPRFGDDPMVVEAARIRLANAILVVCTTHSRDPEALAREALAVLALEPRPAAKP